MESGFLDNFVLPEGAAEKIKSVGMSSQKLGEGVEMMNFGHDKGVAYRFFLHQLRNEVKSKIARLSIPDSIEMIEWMPDGFQKPTERVKFLPIELLEFEQIELLKDGVPVLDKEGYPVMVNGECIGGAYKATYDAWKKGLNAPGLALSRWGVLSDSSVFTLHEMKIFSVEQFAAQPRSKIERLPIELKEAFDQAIEYCNGKAGRDATSAMASELLELKQANAKRDAEIVELRALVAGNSPAPKKRGRPAKVIVDNGEIKDVD